MRLYQWASDDWSKWAMRACCVRTEGGLYDGDATIYAVYRYQGRALSNKEGARSPLTTEKLLAQAAIRRMNEMKLARLEGKLIDVNELRDLWAEICTEFRKIVQAIPVRVAAELPHLTRHDLTVMERECKDALRMNALAYPELGPLPEVRE
jgi:phage terminase Nu1 subunit (DNA packaging protein)